MKASRWSRRIAVLCTMGAGIGMSLAQTPDKAAEKTPPPPEITTGPEAGEKAPDFEVVDHHGRTQTLKSLSGPNGLLLLFHRSADW